MLHSHKNLVLEIQGLRAMAVLAVLFYHLWPRLVPGGYVGVDVFFVISGYLITGTLVREIETTGGISIPGFYARRIRRLLPAAAVVTLSVALSLPLFLRSKWGDIVSSILASTFYVQNWFLAAQAVDYLADDTKGPMNHFWSLSVEEQYYIIWPLLLLFGLYVARRSRLGLRMIFGLLAGLIGLGSLAYSIVLTPTNPGVAYFATSTRAWELALGGALAISQTRWSPSHHMRAILGLVGLGAILVTCFAYSNETSFPGYAALLPTLGAAAVILSCGAGSAWSARGLLSSKPAQYLGDISYSLYLWHWPLIVVYHEMAGEAVGMGAGFALLLLSLALAHLTKVFVEDPFRKSGFAINRTLVAGACSLALTAFASTSFIMLDKDEPQPVAASGAPRGALTMRDPQYDWRKEDLAKVTPEIKRIRRDVSSAYRNKCHQNVQGTEVLTCDYGSSDSAMKIVMLGDSNATQWFPAFEEIAKRRSLYFRGVAKSACLFSFREIHSDGKEPPYKECLEWTGNVINWLRQEKPDLVIIAQSSVQGTSRIDEMAETWKKLIEMGLKVTAIKSIPSVPFKPDECLEKSKDWVSDCKFDRASAFKHDPVQLTAEKLNVKMIDFSDYFCKPDTCPLVIGGVVVYRDSNHLTATFTRSFSSMIEDILLPNVPKRSLPSQG